MVTGTRFNRRGFSLFELMLVIVIIGIMLAVILPQAQRAQYEAKMSIVRQSASEAGSYLVSWAQKQAHARPGKDSLTIENFLIGNVHNFNLDPSRLGPVNHYTGNSAFDGVESIINNDFPLRNPFNQVSIFDPVNDDKTVPGKQPGLLFLIAEPMGEKNSDPKPFNNLYFIYTGTDDKWYGSIDSSSEDGIRRGIFVARFSTLQM